MKNELIRKYARLIARIGANIEQGETVVIYSDVETYGFIATLTEDCYLAGASEVRVEWGSGALTRIHYEYRTLASFKKIPAWQTAKMRERANKLPTRIHIISDAPDALAGIDMEKYQTKLICAAIVSPDLNNAELQNSYGVMTPEDLIKEMVDSPAEYTDLMVFIQQLSGFKTLQEEVDEAKN